jgi:uncharacterized protein (DUF1330 family)
MKTHHMVALGALAGFALGSVAVQTLHAQAKPPVYYVAQIEVADQAGYEREFFPQSVAAVQAKGGRFLVQGGKVTSLAGNPPPSRIVVQQWDSMEALTSWFNSDEQKKLRDIQAKYAKAQSFAVEGVAQR